MNLIEELRALDPRDPGRWPFPVLAGAVGACFVVLTAVLTYLFVWQNAKPRLDRYEAQEITLRQQLQQKHEKAVNLKVYRQQLKDIETSFGALLRQLPGKTQVPNLLVDISQTGLAAGLKQTLFQPGPEIEKAFYAELPIHIRLQGSYHQFGAFVSGIAALPRIVTLHNIHITRSAKNAYDDLTLDLTAKTYRYLDAAELAAAAAKRRGRHVVRRR